MTSDLSDFNPAAQLGREMQCSDEQAMLLDSATSFCRDQSTSAKVRALIGSDTGFDAAVWRAMVEMGWLGLAVPEAQGGSGLSLGHTAVLAEPMGRHLLATPFASTQALVQGLLACGSAALQQQWLPAVCAGSVGSLALFEDDGDWTLTQPACTAERTGLGFKLHGRKTLVPDAGVAQALWVSVKLDGALALALLDSSALPPGALQRDTVVDETRRVWSLDLAGVALPADALVTAEAAQRTLQAITEAAWLLAAAEAAGGLAGVLAVVVDYLNTRSAFGRKIGSYQGLKHPCADMLCELERARSHVHHAAARLINGQPAETALRMAKAAACEAFAQAGDRAVQFHGGLGFTYDCDAQLYLRRALWLQPWFGDAPHHRRRLADRLWPVAGPG